MELEQLTNDLAKRFTDGSFVRATFSQPRAKTEGIMRIKAKPVMLKDKLHIQFEEQFERVLKHHNITEEDLVPFLANVLTRFRQVQAECTNEVIHVQLTKKYKISWKSSQRESTRTPSLSHNRKKNYLLEEGTPYPFLIRLGVQTTEGQVKKQKYDKFRQINRFIEYIDDALAHLPSDRPVRILDFGSGKSYLTFALYHYLHIEKGLDIRVTGLDLKKEVIEECQEIANDLGFNNLEFLVGDINEYEGETAVDMVVTLHACDTATDMALARAVRWGASVILSVPCCQHELFRQLHAPSLDVMLQHGLVKERFAALATDSIRAELLTLAGYETQLLEFIDMAHTPKNILIRAYRSNSPITKEAINRYKNFCKLLNATPFLEGELKLDILNQDE